MTTISSITAHAVSKVTADVPPTGKDGTPGENKAHEDRPGGEEEEEEEIEEALKCGYLCWRPDWLQKFNHPRYLLVCVCWSTFIQGLVINGFTPVNLSSIERRYDMSSSSAAWIPSSYDVSAGVCAVVFGYLAMFLHMGRLIGTCTMVMAAGSFVMLIPHMLSGLYTLGPRPADLCLGSDNETDFCATYDESGDNSYLPLFIIGQILHGVGGAAIYTVANPYMDENIKSTSTALYIGIMQCFAALGPACGYIFGGLLLSIYVDYNKVDLDDISITPLDPRWVGAWWIGYAFSTVASATVSLAYFGFPRELSTAKKNRAYRHSEAYKGKGEDDTEREDYGKSMKDVLTALKRLFTNPTWVFLTIGATMESAGVVAFAVFLPKVLQFQFSQSLVKAAIWSGVVVIPGAAGGQLMGGLVPKLMNLKLRGLLLQCVICSGIGFLLTFQFLLRCQMPDIAGLSVPFFNRSIELEGDQRDLGHPCNYDCNCTTRSYDPTCGQDGVQYFTPCHAGCTERTYVEEYGTTVFRNCSCVAEPEEGWAWGSYAQAQAGVCETDCAVFGVFLFFFFFINVTTFMTSIPGQAATMRCVTDKERPFAFGVQATFVRFLGNVPGPIVLGTIFDSSCWVWQDTCGDTGACWVYDSAVLSLGITLTGIVLKCISFTSFTLAFFLYRPPTTEVLNEVDIDGDTAESSTDTDPKKTPDENRGSNDEADTGPTYYNATAHVQNGGGAANGTFQADDEEDCGTRL